MLALILALLAPAEGVPLLRWGSRPAVIVAEGVAEGASSSEARVTAVHAAVDGGALVLRFTFDRAVRAALYLPDGTPVSGRLRAVVYLDADDDRSTGFDSGPRDLRTGSERRLEIGVVSLGADDEENRAASALVTATLTSLARDGRRRTLWAVDDDAVPARLSVHGEWVEVRLPPEHAVMSPGARLILAQGDRTWDGRLR